MKSIEERANEKYPVHLVTRNGMPWTEYDANEKKRNFYIEIATEQKELDDADLAEVKRQRDEYYDELLELRRQKVELIEKACAWLKRLPPQWEVYEDAHYEIDRDSIIEELRKYME